MTEPRPAHELAVEAAWTQLETAWDDAAAHERFLSLCAGLGQLGEAGRRYRAVRERDPERREEADRRIAALFVLATQQLRATATPPKDPSASRRLFYVAVGVALTMVLIAAWQILRYRS